jgi:hypothetical protein
MARIRTIKPEFPQSESMGRVSREARLCFILVWTICDDSGRARASSRMLASLLYPYDEDAGKRIDGWLAELERENCIVRYEAEGNTYLEVRNWLNHQRIDKPSASKIPPFEEASRILANPRESSCEEGKGREGKGRERKLATVFIPSNVTGLDLTAWADWIAYRQSLSKPLKEQSLPAAAAELAALGDRQAASVRHSIASGYRGIFEPPARAQGSGTNGTKPPLPPFWLGPGDTNYNPAHKAWMEKYG